ncbi:F0F1 ATP synthase subunit B [Aestuariivirga sp.]|uniref:F0F1 ATP synthase subunit B n=1 Tax=Aestuariivirga sp. TaxID=2650926 RepID=UPI003593CB7A
MSQSTTVLAQAETEAPAAETPATAEAGHTEGTAAEGGHGGAFPPMDTSTYPSQIFWLFIFFGLLYLLMSRVALPKMAAVLEKRSARIESDLAKAQTLKNETEAAVAAYEKALADARAKAQDIAVETRNRMASEMDAERASLEKTLAAKVSEAEAKIAAARAASMKDVGEVAAESAAEIVAELTGSKVSKDAAAQVIAGLKA